MYDLVIQNGRVVDGTGSPWFVADVGVRGGRVSRVGVIADADAARTIDARGLTVAPGFVDIHSHADFVLPTPNHMDVLGPLMLQGITTLVTGNCGLSTAPLSPENLTLLADYTAFFQSEGFCFDWSSMGQYLDALSGRGVGFNVVPLTSHGAVRIAAMGFAAGPPSDQQLGLMRALVQQSLEEGAFGVSAGLIYAPGMYASTAELIAVTEPLMPKRGVFTCHVRGSSETALESTREIIEIARVNDIPVEHSHIEAFGEPYWASIDKVIELHDDARAEGLDVSFDVIPYTTANTFLAACFPPYALEGGMDSFVDRLKDPVQRERLRKDVETMRSEWPTWRPNTWPHNLARATGWKNIRLLWAAKEHNVVYTGKSFVEIAQMQGKTPFDAAADLLIDEHGVALALYVGVSGDLDDDEGLKKFLRHPNGAINTDAILTGRGMPHPAAYGAFPRVLGQYVREQNLMSLEEAVRKITSLPLRRFNVQDRGLLREGMWADITVFDAETIRDNSTYLDPAQGPSGIEYVVVNGQVTVEQGELLTATRPAGQVLRH
ncbi:MAG: D-aminoacylase [bacterium]